MQQRTFDAIPGLFVYLDHFGAAQCASLLQQSTDLYGRLEEALARSGAADKAHIPQPEFVRSAKHNLTSEEFYARVVLTEANDRQVSCEYFPRYGEDGHALGYFR